MNRRRIPNVAPTPLPRKGAHLLKTITLSLPKGGGCACILWDNGKALSKLLPITSEDIKISIS